MIDVHNSIKGAYMSAHLNKFIKKVREKGSTVRFVNILYLFTKIKDIN